MIENFKSACVGNNWRITEEGNSLKFLKGGLEMLTLGGDNNQYIDYTKNATLEICGDNYNCFSKENARYKCSLIGKKLCKDRYVVPKECSFAWLEEESQIGYWGDPRPGCSSIPKNKWVWIEEIPREGKISNDKETLTPPSWGGNAWCCG